MFLNALAIAFILTGLADFAQGHAALIEAIGSSGGTGVGFGVRANTPRNSGNGEAQADSTGFNGQQTGCGSTSGFGPNDIQQGLTAAVAAGLPVVTAGGTLSMTMQIVNDDGAGPFNCRLDTTGTGQSFTPIEVTTNSNSRQAPAPANIVAAMPADLACSGTSGAANNICIVRCEQNAGFGGCVAVQGPGGAAAGGNGNGNGNGSGGNGNNNGNNGNNGNGNGNGQGNNNNNNGNNGNGNGNGNNGNGNLNNGNNNGNGNGNGGNGNNNNNNNNNNGNGNGNGNGTNNGNNGSNGNGGNGGDGGNGNNGNNGGNGNGNNGNGNNGNNGQNQRKRRDSMRRLARLQRRQML